MRLPPDREVLDMMIEKPLNILVVDDDPIARCILEDHVAASGHKVAAAENAAQAMRLLELAPAHIVIADWVMPDLSGLDLCRWVRGRRLPRGPHFVMLTALSDKARLVEAFDAGADDFLSKPFHEPELVARLRAWARLVALQEELAARHEESRRLARELLAANDRLAEVAATDELTGLGNRRQATRRLADALAVATRYARPLACASVDIDHFKRVNDAHGHAAGDAVLRHVANVLKATTRAADAVFRTGGDEFLVILPEQTAAQAARWADRCRQVVAADPLRHRNSPIPVSISIGIGQCPARPAGAPAPADPDADAAAVLDALLESADRAMYADKRAGRDRDPPRSLSA